MSEKDKIDDILDAMKEFCQGYGSLSVGQVRAASFEIVRLRRRVASMAESIAALTKKTSSNHPKEVAKIISARFGVPLVYENGIFKEDKSPRTMINPVQSDAAIKGATAGESQS